MTPKGQRPLRCNNQLWGEKGYAVEKSTDATKRYDGIGEVCSALRPRDKQIVVGVLNEKVQSCLLPCILNHRRIQYPDPPHNGDERNITFSRRKLLAIGPQRLRSGFKTSLRTQTQCLAADLNPKKRNNWS